MNYNKLWKLLIDKKLRKKDLREMAGLSTNVIAKMGISVFVASFVPLCKRAANQATGRQLERMGELGAIWC